MGRVLKRVPLDFAWPKDTVWSGYLNPHYVHSSNCVHCGGTGGSPTANKLKGQWYGYAPFDPESRGSKPFLPSHPYIQQLANRNAPEWGVVAEANRLARHFNKGWCHHLSDEDVKVLIAEDRLRDFTHEWKGKERWVKKVPDYIPTAEEVNEWSMRGFGHDSINQWILVKAECARLNVSNECEHCAGNGTVWNPPEAEQLADDWKNIEPPTGDGYQLWETVSEGSPISPVFATPEELANYLATNEDYKWKRNDAGTTCEQWLKFIMGTGWSVSMAVQDGKVMTGVQAASI